MEKKGTMQCEAQLTKSSSDDYLRLWVTAYLLTKENVARTAEETDQLRVSARSPNGCLQTQ
ncbi:hypothetical protein T4B_14023 [Trichinella pseudospiralis]|uniref:Uncharacterized protein n=1 Tax=Trichinella pseudospiralis TaxID=6337 RepID=A0A0V1GZN5_TRIPS|nr:hypothetical protein T4B_14023 [Trichinella pseudospiralis]